MPGSAVWTADLPLVGPRGEPVDLWRVLLSHGCALLPPGHLDESARVFEVTLRVDGGRPRTVQIAAGRPGHARLTAAGPPPSARQGAALIRAARHILRLDEDLSPFYTLIRGDPDLAWAARGAGRMARGMTVFEDVVKTICTTNCTWAATERMVQALVAHLGVPAAGAPRSGWRGRTFPTPEAMAACAASAATAATPGWRSGWS